MGLFVKSWVGAKIENGPGAAGGGVLSLVLCLC